MVVRTDSTIYEEFRLMNKLRFIYIAGVTCALFLPSQFIYANPAAGAAKQDRVEVVATDEEDDVAASADVF